MAKRTADKLRRDDLLALVPPGAERIYVRMDNGKCRYRLLHELADSDVIQVNKEGVPITMKGAPGRKKSVVVAPATPEVAENVRRKGEAINQDPILTTARDRPEDPDVLHQVVLALGEEAASIGFERSEAERKGEDTTNLSVKRIGALKAIAETWLKRQDQVGSRGIDMDSAVFRALLKFLMETFREALDACNVRVEMTETVFAKLAKMMNDEWEAEAKNRMKNVT